MLRTRGITKGAYELLAGTSSRETPQARAHREERATRKARNRKVFDLRRSAHHIEKETA